MGCWWTTKRLRWRHWRWTKQSNTLKHIETLVETLRLDLCKILKTPVKFQNWLKKNDKASSGLLLRVGFGKVVGKVAQKVGTGEVAESVMEAIWVSVKEGSGKEVAWDVVEHEVVKQWVFGKRGV